LVDVALFSAETHEMRIETGPNHTATRKQAETLHRNIEGRGVGIGATVVGRPESVHSLAPLRLKIGAQSSKIVKDERPMEEIQRSGMFIEVAQEPCKSAGHYEHVTVHADNEFTAGLCEHRISDGGARRDNVGDVAVILNMIFKVLERPSTGPVRM